jgi:hypothetical protein
MTDDKKRIFPGEDFADQAEEEARIANEYALKTAAAEKAKRQQAEVRVLMMLSFGADGYNIFPKQIEK